MRVAIRLLKNRARDTLFQRGDWMMHDGRTALSAEAGKRRTGYRLALCLLVLWFLMPAVGAHSAPEDIFDFRLSGGYRRGGLRWNIAGEYGDPNVLSELTWSELQVSEIEAAASLNIEGFTVRAVVGYGCVSGGDVQDSDYDSDDRTDEWSRSISKAKGGYLLHALTGLGYRFDLRAAPVSLLPMIGIGFHRQAMKMTGGEQVIATSGRTPPLGPIDGLDSSYTANWLNLWVGLDAEYRSAGLLSAGAAVSVHPSLYYAEADWNLRDDFAHPVSFVHKAFGWGLRGDLWLGVELSRGFLLEGRFAVDYWFAGPGVEETYLAAGGSVETRLNEVVWRSARFSIGTVLRL